MKNNILVTKENMALRLVQNVQADMKLILKWLSDPQVLRWVYEEGTPWDLQKVIDNFAEQTEEGGSVIACFIMQNDEEIGYIQYYPIQEDSYKFNSPDMYEKVKNGYGVDIFIGESRLWGNGIGEKAIELMEHFIINNTNATMLCSDPATENGRAVRFWHKAGFQPVDLIENYDDCDKKSILMVKMLNRE